MKYIIVENVSIALFRVTTGWLLIFLPYIHPNIHCFSLFYTKKKNLFGDFAPMPSPGHHPGHPGFPRPPAAIVLALSKIDVPIFFVYYPLLSFFRDVCCKGAEATYVEIATETKRHAQCQCSLKFLAHINMF